jgi:hypothetical protein
MKKDWWRKLMKHFVLPLEYNKHDEEGNAIPGGRERRRLVKEFALKKMDEAFRTFKKNLFRDYVSKKKTPEFKGQYERLKELWPKFVKQKESEHAKAISEKIRQMRLKRVQSYYWARRIPHFGA